MRLILLCLIPAKLLILASLYYTFKNTFIKRDTGHYVYVPPGSTKKLEIAKAQKDFFLRLAPLDGQFYRKIATEGYSFQNSLSYAFFPLFPALTRAAASIAGRPVLWGIILNFFFSLAALLVIGCIVKLKCKSHPLPPLLLLLAFPSSGIYNFYYTESLFLFLSASCFYACMDRRFFLAGVLGFLCALTRYQGILLTFPLACEILKQIYANRNGILKKEYLLRLSPALLPLAGMLIYAFYVALHTGSLLSLFEVQKAWGRKTGGLLSLFHAKAAPTDLMGALFGITLIPYLFKKLPLPFAVYGASMAVFPLATGSFLSYLRFIGTSFPHFLVLSEVLKNRPVFWLAALVIFWEFQLLINQGLLAWRFVL